MTDNGTDAAAAHSGPDAPPVDRATDGPDEPEQDRSGSAARRPHYAPPTQEQFDWRGWVLVGVVVLSFLVVPVSILYLPQAQSLVKSLGLTLRAAYIALPMVTAVVLGATAVWAALRSRAEE